ncbi:MAG: sporulation protein [Clostridiales bacterium]|nr:sporulation protein [Clostridiales bacterium]
MSDNNFNSTVESLFKGMDNFLTTKTVVGDAVKFDDGTIILPLVEVSFGVGAGAFSGDSKNNAGGGMGGKIIPSSVLVIQNGTSKLVNIKDQDSVTKILDMVPDLINKFTKKDKDTCKEADDHENDDLDEKVQETMKCQSKVTRYDN